MPRSTQRICTLYLSHGIYFFTFCLSQRPRTQMYAYFLHSVFYHSKLHMVPCQSTLQLAICSGYSTLSASPLPIETLAYLSVQVNFLPYQQKCGSLVLRRRSVGDCRVPSADSVVLGSHRLLMFSRPLSLHKTLIFRPVWHSTNFLKVTKFSNTSSLDLKKNVKIRRDMSSMNIKKYDEPPRERFSNGPHTSVCTSYNNLLLDFQTPLEAVECGFYFSYTFYTAYCLRTSHFLCQAPFYFLLASSNCHNLSGHIYLHCAAPKLVLLIHTNTNNLFLFSVFKICSPFWLTIAFSLLKLTVQPRSTARLTDTKLPFICGTCNTFSNLSSQKSV
ncbi:uncharacterized protein LOC125776679 [Bactrocera dorsalis]|uniref:Uncharacterized protein LOC125776679 n=1 Tax=Bactrocera dorsalis TaxID=27457 RepID=A0ABM3JAA6_BACDO|nr:uncharacterized protein LOC125776679 [Bactrocera dorsalis]